MKKITNYETVTWELAEAEGEAISPQAVHKLFCNDPGIDWDTEQMWVVGMNVKNNIHLRHLVAKGTWNQALVTPADVLVSPLRMNLRHIIIVHNHPTSHVHPSEEDIVITRKIHHACKLLGIQLLDHVIISEDEWYSFKKGDLL